MTLQSMAAGSDQLTATQLQTLNQPRPWECKQVKRTQCAPAYLLCWGLTLPRKSSSGSWEATGHDSSTHPGPSQAVRLVFQTLYPGSHAQPHLHGALSSRPDGTSWHWTGQWEPTNTHSLPCHMASQLWLANIFSASAVNLPCCFSWGSLALQSNSICTDTHVVSLLRATYGLSDMCSRGA